MILLEECYFFRRMTSLILKDFFEILFFSRMESHICYRALALIKRNNQKYHFDFEVKSECVVCKQPATTCPKIDDTHELTQ